MRGSGSAGSPRARRRRPGPTRAGRRTEAEFERALDANALFLAEEDGEPVGFVTSWLEEHVARIGDLYVAERSAANGSRARARRRGDREPARPGRDAPPPEREPGRAAVLRAARLPRGVAQPRAAARRARASAAAARSARSTSRPTTRRRSSGPCASSCRASRAARRAASSRRRATAGSRSTTTSATATRDAAPARARALRADRARSSSRSASSTSRSSASSCFEAGRVVDEYLSVPEHYGPLPPGDVIALAANPRVVARLTGADPAAVRAVARTAALPGRAAAAAGAARRHRGRDRARGRRARLGRRAGDPGRDRGATA